MTDEKTAIITYGSCVESGHRYGLIIWGSSTDINIAFIVQKNALEVCVGLAH